MKKLLIDFHNSKDNNEAILFYSLFSAWLLTLPFEGQILSCLYSHYSMDLKNLSFLIIGVLIIGHIAGGYLVDDIKKARKALKFITYIVIFGSLVFFLPPSSLWTILILILSFLGGIYISTWGFYYRLVPSGQAKIRAIAKVLILSNILMLLINVISINISPFLGLGLSILFLILSLVILKQSNEKDRKIIR